MPQSIIYIYVKVTRSTCETLPKMNSTSNNPML